MKTPEEIKAERSRNLRYKRPALASMGYDSIVTEMWDISEACSDVQYFVDSDDGTLLNALSGDEDAEWEFKLAFSDLSGKAEQLHDALQEWTVREDYDDCTVALIGNRYRSVGYDGMEEDYFALTAFEGELATTEAGKRLMRYTKKDMISHIGQSVGILVAFLDLRQSYDYLKATMDILRDENTSLLQVIREIEAAYDAASEVGLGYGWKPEVKRFDSLISGLPDRTWIE